jgi:hypothetical protein
MAIAVVPYWFAGCGLDGGLNASDRRSPKR